MTETAVDRLKSRFQGYSETRVGATRGGATAPRTSVDVTPLHLVQRATFGATPELLAEVTAKGTAAWLDEQLAPQTIADAECDGYLTRFPTLGWTATDCRANLDNGSWTHMQEIVRATMVRAVYSRRQLLEVMVDLWSNHLNVTCPSSEVWDSRGVYDRDVIRKHALGRFSDMLLASAKSAAMGRYLDNSSSHKRAPNENYGRELLELHTVGVDGGYAQRDVVDCARTFTGWSISDTTYDFEYKPTRHWVGPVRVLGWSHANPTADAGLAAGESLISYLAHHPRTAYRIAQKLCIRFVSDAPPRSLVERLASVYLANDTGIVPVLRALFASPEFAASAGQKVRRPLEDVYATARILGVKPNLTHKETISPVAWKLGDAGHAPLGWAPPNGYPDVAAAWTSPAAVLSDWNMHLGFVDRWWKDHLVSDPISSLIPLPAGATCGQLIDAITQRLCFRRFPEPARQALLTFLGRAESYAADRVDGWTRSNLAAVVLDSPYFLNR